MPAYNEEKVIVQTIASLLSQKYSGPIEIVVVDDGSSDETIDIVREAYGSHPSISAYRKENGGKASTLNYGIAHAQHEIVIGLDADTIFDDDTVAELVQPLKDWVAAVAGNAKVGNRINLVTRWQALACEPDDRPARLLAARLHHGGTWRGGRLARARSCSRSAAFARTTLAEDQDLTLAIPAPRASPSRDRGRRGGLHRGSGHAARPGEAAFPLVVRNAAMHVEAPRRLLPAARCGRWGRRTAERLPVPASAAGISPVADFMFVWSIASVWFNARVHTVDGRLRTPCLTSSRSSATTPVFLLVDGGGHRLPHGRGRGQESHLVHLRAAIRLPAGDARGGRPLLRRGVERPAAGLGEAGAEGDRLSAGAPSAIWARFGDLVFRRQLRFT